ncbi:MAG: hypothetical protein LBM72_02875 [Mycoplasmataceae bacterium]|jgi:riboflavin kinase/FMN adenylyltransferase|nr:hypothetical protein [Mycoplasmataceae bacterium]
MKLINLKANTFVKPSKQPLIIGFFDGLHRGHQVLFRGLKTNKFDILTFINVPSKSSSFIYSNNLRIADLIQLKPNHLYILDLKVFNMRAAKFANFIKEHIKPEIIYIGKNFKFGSDHKKYQEFVNNNLKVRTFTITPQHSSTKAKALLKHGKIQELNKLLLDPYNIVGKVVIGKKLGRKLGYRTANVMIDKNCIAPANGSYYGYTYVNDVKFESAIFVRNHLVETHIFNFNRDIYGNVITIEFKKFHQAPNKTASFNNLKKILDKKIKNIKVSF